MEGGRWRRRTPGRGCDGAGHAQVGCGSAGMAVGAVVAGTAAGSAAVRQSGRMNSESRDGLKQVPEVGARARVAAVAVAA